MIFKTICVGPMAVNCYILAEEKNSAAIIIDPGAEAGKIKKVLAEYKLKAAFLVNTHGHFDHIGCDDEFGVPVYIHKDDALLLTDAQSNLSALFSSQFAVKSRVCILEDKGDIKLDNIHLKVLHVPGHTPGGIALLMINPDSKILFTGDALFCGGIGRTDFAGGNEKLLIKSIKEKLLSLPDGTVIYPGHGPSSTIGEEKIHNPFLN
jgi:hydroxyacylglutathione hydrolase